MIAKASLATPSGDVKPPLALLKPQALWPTHLSIMPRTRGHLMLCILFAVATSKMSEG
jgi:hypothetical protein